MNSDQFELIDEAREKLLCERIPRAPFFPSLVGLVMDGARRGYAKMALPYRMEVTQPSGIIHGSAVAALIDTVAVTAILSGLNDPHVARCSGHRHDLNPVPRWREDGTGRRKHVLENSSRR
jgi:acyl-coenzyme A thioesterase PaaI-like protein